MAGINFVRRWVMSQMTKKADDGIMITLPDSSKVDLNVNITMDRLLRNGIDPDAFTNPEQVNNAINMLNTRMVERAIPANSAEGREITEKLFGKQKAPVFDLEGNRIPEESGIMGGKSVKDLMDSGQVTKGARGMKKSKKVEDREMFKAANERLTSDVDTIVKNIKRLSPMDAMKEANLVIGRKGYYKNLSPEESKKILKDTEDHIFERDIPEDPEGFATGGRIGLFAGAVASGENISPGTDKKGNVRDDNPFTGGGGGGNNNNNNPPPVSTNNLPPDTTFFDKTSKSGLMSNISPSILARLARIKKGITPILGEDVGLQYQNIDEIKDIFTNFKITQDLEDLIKTKKLEPELKYRKEIGDNTLIEGGINQAGDANIMFKKQFADGGRAGFMAGGMGRRAFLKLMGGTGAAIGAAKSGIFSGLGKGAGKEVTKEVVKQSASTPPPYFFKLAEKIKMLGDDATATTDRTIAKTLKSKDGKSTYLLEEDVTSGDTIIKKINKEGDEMITDVEIMELRKGEVVKGKDGKAMKTPDEYEEVTEANARIEGDTFNDPYYSDGIEIDDILREVDDIPVPKASGGIARMLGE